jgi:hypothetical protein
MEVWVTWVTTRHNIVVHIANRVQKRSLARYGDMGMLHDAGSGLR